MILQHLLVVTSALFTCPCPDVPAHLHMHLSQSPLFSALSHYAHFVTEEISVFNVLILIPKIPGIARNTRKTVILRSLFSPSILPSTMSSHAKVHQAFGTGRILPILLFLMFRFSLISRHSLKIIYTYHVKKKDLNYSRRKTIKSWCKVNRDPFPIRVGTEPAFFLLSTIYQKISFILLSTLFSRKKHYQSIFIIIPKSHIIYLWIFSYSKKMRFLQI